LQTKLLTIGSPAKNTINEVWRFAGNCGSLGERGKKAKKRKG
jgi:hypothetical protein